MRLTKILKFSRAFLTRDDTCSAIALTKPLSLSTLTVTKPSIFLGGTPVDLQQLGPDDDGFQLALPAFGARLA